MQVLHPLAEHLAQQSSQREALGRASQASLLRVSLQPLLPHSRFTRCPGEATNTSTASARAGAFSAGKTGGIFILASDGEAKLLVSWPQGTEQ